MKTFREDEFRARATGALGESGSYREGSVLVERTGAGYRVVFGGRVMLEGADMESAVLRLVHYTRRRCTSCGARGCPADLVGRQSLVVEPLPFSRT